MNTLAGLALRIVEAEGPIHEEEVARRIAACFGKEKAGSRIVSAGRLALFRAKSQNPHLRSDGDFYFTEAQSNAPPVRDRSNESGSVLKAASLSILEIREALRLAAEDNAGGDSTDLVRTAARLMGFRRVGPDLQVRIASVLT